MSSDLLTLDSKPHASYMIAGWKPQWSDGGEISSGLPEYLISKFNAKRIGGFTREITMTCYPFQVPGHSRRLQARGGFRSGTSQPRNHQGQLRLRRRKRVDNLPG